MNEPPTTWYSSRYIPITIGAPLLYRRSQARRRVRLLVGTFFAILGASATYALIDFLGGW